MSAHEKAIEAAARAATFDAGTQLRAGSANLLMNSIARAAVLAWLEAVVVDKDQQVPTRAAAKYLLEDFSP